MPDTNTGNIIPRTRADFIHLARNVILLVAMAGAAYGGTEAANESRLDRVEAKVERIESQLDRILQKLADDPPSRQAP